MTDQHLDEVINVTLGGLDLESVDENAIIRRLDKELQQQSEASALGATLQDGEPSSPWVLGGAEAGGFGPMAQRFLAFYTDAIHREICSPDSSGLKDTYRNLLGGQSTQEQVRSLVPTLINAIGASAALINPAAIAALVALWLIRTGLDQWCTVPRSAPAADKAGAPAPAETSNKPADPTTPPVPSPS
jgi:hypothetical protein